MRLEARHKDATGGIPANRAMERNTENNKNTANTLSTENAEPTENTAADTGSHPIDNSRWRNQDDPEEKRDEPTPAANFATQEAASQDKAPATANVAQWGKLTDPLSRAWRNAMMRTQTQ